MTAGILRSTKFLYRNNLYKNLIKTDLNTSEYSTLDNNLRIYKTILRKNIRLAKANYYANRLEQHKSAMRRTWSTINDILNKNRQKKLTLNYIVVKDKKIMSPVEIANQFNKFFSNIGKNLSEKYVVILKNMCRPFWNKKSFRHSISNVSIASMLRK